MDTLLVRGDHFLDGRGLPVTLTGSAELIQRALIRLSVRRGSFSLDPSLGSELHRLPGARLDIMERLALSYAQEALLPMAGVSVSQVQLTRSGRDALQMIVFLTYNEQTYPLEVTIES